MRLHVTESRLPFSACTPDSIDGKSNPEGIDLFGRDGHPEEDCAVWRGSVQGTAFELEAVDKFSWRGSPEDYLKAGAPDSRL